MSLYPVDSTQETLIVEPASDKPLQEILLAPNADVVLYNMYLDAKKQVSEGQCAEGSWDAL